MSEIKSAGAITKARDAQKVREQGLALADQRISDCRRLINKMMPAFSKALPSVLTPDRFTRMVLTAISNNPKLAECSQQSFLGAVMVGAQLGLEMNTPEGFAYLIPRWNSKKGCNECTFQIGYKGILQLVYRSGSVTGIEAGVICENDKVTYRLGLNAELNIEPPLSNRGNVIAYYAIYRTKDGGKVFEVMSKDDVQKHAESFSESVKKGYSSPWKTNFDEMAKKTVIKRLLKYAPMSSEFVRAVAGDEQVRQMSSSFDGDILDEPVIYAEEAVVDTETGEIKE